VSGTKEGGLGFRVQKYGIVKWGDLFTPRQALALSAFVRLIQQAGESIRQQDDAGLALAVQVCLVITLSRLADFCSSLCVLNSTGNRGCKNTFARQALPIVWDFMETNPLNRVGANWLGSVNALEATIRAEAALGNCGQAQAASATDHPLPSDIAGALFTDPPSYDAVPYSDLSDYFYVWLRRSLPADIKGAGFDQVLTPKEAECIVDEVKHKDRAFFERSMGQSMAEARRVLGPAGIGVVVFAHKSTGGWEALLQAMVDAGWIVTGSWPIDTERPGRLRAMASAALASSVHLVCRPRENPDGSLRADEIGEWREVLQELPRRIHGVPIEISGLWENDPGERRLMIEALEASSFSDALEPAVGGDGGIAAMTQEFVIDGLRLRYTNAAGQQTSTTATFDPKTGNIDAASRERDDFVRTTLLSARAYPTLGRHAQQYSSLLKKKQGHDVLEAVRIIEPQVQRIEVLTEPGGPSIYVDLGLESLVPLAVCGEGFVRLFSTVVELTGTRNGVLLIDEIDNGLHHSVMPRLWDLLGVLSERHDVQIFGTTHNDDLIRSALQAFSVRSGFLGLFRVDRHDGFHSMTSYDEEAMEAVLDEQFEVRG
jgi:hypothetical protein